MIFPLWQPLGSSSHLLAHAAGKAEGETATHTGTLDPLASGVLVVLTGEDRHIKGSLSDWKKTYQFEILWGVATDSGDGLGVITTTSSAIPQYESIQHVVESFPSEYEQLIPSFSARRFNGRSSFEWAREGIALPAKKRAVTLENFHCLGMQKLTNDEVITTHASNISAVHGPFRQVECLQSWQVLHNSTKSYLITSHQVTTSAGTYIRQLAQDLAHELDTSATTWKITRIQNGPFTESDCRE